MGQKKLNPDLPSPDIYTYHDYRLFLQDLISYLKCSTYGFSLRQAARNSRLSVGYLSMVLSGKRNLSPAKATQLLMALGLSANEQSFFLHLCQFNDSPNIEEKAESLRRLQRFSAYQQNHPAESELFEYASHWYYVAIREMAALPIFLADPAWIQPRLRFPVSQTEIQRALDFLLRSGLLKKDSDGNLISPEPKLRCVGSVFRLALQSFHRDILGLAARALTEVTSKEREISGYTVAIAEEDLERVREILERAKQEIASLVDGSPKKKTVYHFAVIGVPLTADFSLVSGLPQGRKDET